MIVFKFIASVDTRRLLNVPLMRTQAKSFSTRKSKLLKINPLSPRKWCRGQGTLDEGLSVLDLIERRIRRTP